MAKIKNKRKTRTCKERNSALARCRVEVLKKQKEINAINVKIANIRQEIRQIERQF